MKYNCLAQKREISNFLIFFYSPHYFSHLLHFMLYSDLQTINWWTFATLHPFNHSSTTLYSSRASLDPSPFHLKKRLWWSLFSFPLLALCAFLSRPIVVINSHCTFRYFHTCFQSLRLFSLKSTCYFYFLIFSLEIIRYFQFLNLFPSIFHTNYTLFPLAVLIFNLFYL